MEALIIEKSEALRHIAQFLSPRISGAIYCSEAEKAEYEQERVRLSARIAEIEAIVSGQQRAEEQEQRINEIDEMKLPYDIDADFGTVGVNVFVRRMLKDERANNFLSFNAEYDRLKGENDEELSGYAEREIQLQRQNEELQKNIHNMINDYDKSLGIISELRTDLADVNITANQFRLERDEFELKCNNARTQLEEARTEIERLERLVDEQRIQNAFGERGLQRTIDVTQTVNDLYEQAKQATAEKRKVMVTANLGLYREVQDEAGRKEMVHHSELAGMEQVDSFHIELPSIEGITEQEQEGTGQDVEGSNVVLGGIEDTTTGHSVEGASPASTTAEAIEEAVSEETGKTIEQRVNQLESYMDSVLTKLGLYPDENAT